MLIDRAIEFDRMRRAEPLHSFAWADWTELKNGIRETLFPEIRGRSRMAFRSIEVPGNDISLAETERDRFLHPILNCGDMLRPTSDVAI